METILLFTFILNSLLWVSRKSKGENNFFEVISITLATVILWVLIPYPVAKVYIIASATALIWFRMNHRFNDRSQILVNLREQRLRNNAEYQYIGNKEEKTLKKLSRWIRHIKLTFLFIISGELIIYSYLITQNSPWWIWLILAPVSLICLCIIVLMIKEFFDRL